MNFLHFLSFPFFSKINIFKNKYCFKNIFFSLGKKRKMENTTDIVTANFSQLSEEWRTSINLASKPATDVRLLQSFYIFLNFCSANNFNNNLLLRKYELQPLIATLEEYFEHDRTEKESDLDYLEKKCSFCAKRRSFFLRAKTEEISKPKLCDCFGENFESEMCLHCIASSCIDSLAKSEKIPNIIINESFIFKCCYCEKETDISHLRIALVEKKPLSIDEKMFDHLSLYPFPMNQNDLPEFYNTLDAAHQEIVEKNFDDPVLPLPQSVFQDQNAQQQQPTLEDFENIKNRLMLIENFIGKEFSNVRKIQNPPDTPPSPPDYLQDNYRKRPRSYEQNSSESEQEERESTSAEENLEQGSAKKKKYYISNPSKRSYFCGTCKKSGHNRLSCDYCWKCNQEEGTLVKHSYKLCKRRVSLNKKNQVE
jgi:hypothetical protein